MRSVTVEPVRTMERNPEDNTCYRIACKGFTILHLGDAQGSMSRIDHYDVWVDEADVTPVQIISLEPSPISVPPEGLESSALPGGLEWMHLKPNETGSWHCWSCLP